MGKYCPAKPLHHTVYLMAGAKIQVGIDPFTHSLPLTAETGIEPPTLWLTALLLYWMSVILYAAASVSNNIKAFYHVRFLFSSLSLLVTSCESQRAATVIHEEKRQTWCPEWHSLALNFAFDIQCSHLFNFFTVIALYTIILCKQRFHLRDTNQTGCRQKKWIHKHTERWTSW